MLKDSKIPFKGFHFYLNYKYLQDLIDPLTLHSINFQEVISEKIIDNNLNVLIEKFQLKIQKNQQDYQSHYLLGLSYVYVKNFEKALEFFTKAYNLNPKHFESFLYASRILYFLEDWKNLEELLFFALKIQSHHFEILFYSGHLAFVKGELKKSINFFKAAKKNHPFYYKIDYNLALLYYKIKDFKKAHFFFKKAFKNKASDMQDDLLLQWGNNHYQQKDYKQAIFFYNKDKKKNYNHYYNMGCAYYKKEDKKNALHFYQKAHEKNPLKFEHLNALAILFSDEKDYVKAKDYFEKALTLEDKNIQIWNNFALNQSFLGNLEAAEKAYQKALSLKQDPYVQSNFAAFLFENGNYKEALGFLMESFRMETKNSDAYNNLAAIYLINKEYKLALENLKKAVQFSDKNEQGFLGKNWELLLREIYQNHNLNLPPVYLKDIIEFLIFLLREKKDRKFVDIYEWLLKVTQDDLLKKIENKWIADVYYRLRNYKKSTIFFAKSLELKENLSTKLYFHLAKAYYSLKEYTQAEIIFNTILNKKVNTYKNIDFFLAKISAYQKKYQFALKYYQRALKNVSRKYYSTIFFNIARIYQKNRKWSVSNFYFKKILKDEIYTAKIFYYLSFNFFFLKKLKQVIYYAKLTKKYNNKAFKNLKLMFIVAYSLQKLKKYKKALNIYRYIFLRKPQWKRLTYEMAKLFKILGDYSNAIIYFQKTLLLDESFFRIYLNLAKIFFQTKDYKQCEENLIKFSNFFPNNTPLLYYYYSGLLAFQQKKYTDSIEFLQILIKSFDTEDKSQFSLVKKKNSFLFLAYAYQKEGEEDLFFDVLKKSVLTLESFDNVFLLAKNLYLKNQWDTAQFYFRKLLHYEIKMDLIYFYLGKLMFLQSQFKAAIGYFKKVVKENIHYIKAYYYIAFSYYSMGEFYESLEILKNLLKNFPNHVNSYVLMAKNFYQLKQIHESLLCFEKANTIGIQSAYVYRNWARILNKEKNYQKALEKYQFTLNLSKKDAAIIRLKQIEILILMKRYSEALKILNFLMKKKCNLPKFFFLFGRVHFHLAKFLKAVFFLKKSLKRNYMHYKVLEFLAHAYVKLKLYVKAEKLYRRVLNKHQNFWIFYYYLGKVYFHLHSYNKLIENLEIYILNIISTHKNLVIKKTIQKTYLFLSYAYEKKLNFPKAVYYIKLWSKILIQENSKYKKLKFFKIFKKLQLFFEKNDKIISSDKKRLEEISYYNNLEALIFKQQEFFNLIQKKINIFKMELRKQSLLVHPNKALNKNLFFRALNKSLRSYVQLINKKKKNLFKLNKLLESKIHLKKHNPFNPLFKKRGFLSLSQFIYLCLENRKYLNSKLILTHHYKLDMKLNWENHAFISNLIQISLECIFKLFHIDSKSEYKLDISFMEKDSVFYLFFKQSIPLKFKILLKEIDSFKHKSKGIKTQLINLNLGFLPLLWMLDKYSKKLSRSWKIYYKNDYLLWNLSFSKKLSEL